ncbi:MAG TPA: helix-turn-helix domain-containing protein [Solirubrobacteraceae bacterium]|jgi:DNA-binding HxlR family transcriptional regulator|nr:helix-turn-helix domain-containing protein [Solirubrobacteraceae bacterium]
MERSSYDAEKCSVARTLSVIGDRWTLLILREAFLGVRRFDELQRNLGIARNILTVRLHNLLDAGILRRSLYQERPQRHEYRLTERGVDLYPALTALMIWGDRHMADDGGPPVRLRHRGCGQPSTPTLTCSECGEPIAAREMEVEPASGALVAGA